jgi:hypothetical protein
MNGARNIGIIFLFMMMNELKRPFVSMRLVDFDDDDVKKNITKRSWMDVK